MYWAHTNGLCPVVGARDTTVIKVGTSLSSLCLQPSGCTHNQSCLAYRLASLSLKVKTFSKISRCLSFLIICSQNLLSVFYLPTEVVLHFPSFFCSIFYLLLIRQYWVSCVHPPPISFFCCCCPLFHVFMECSKGVVSPQTCYWVLPLPVRPIIMSSSWKA